MLEMIGDRITELGIKVIPFSFAAFIPFRWLEYLWDVSYKRLVKAFWYLALGILYLNGHVKVNMVVMYICFIEAWDLLFEQLEVRKELKKT